MYYHIDEHMEDQITNQLVPDTVFHTRTRENNQYYWQLRMSRDIFADRKVLVFALPGAFTPTCTNAQLPEIEKLYEKFPVDEIYCLSVNDAFTMHHWAEKLGITKVKMLPDGNGDFTRELGMLVDKSNLGFGERSWRYAILVDDGMITQSWIEPFKRDNCPDDPYEETVPSRVLEDLEAGW